MAYIKTETVKEIRNEIKTNFPAKDGWKFSIVRDNHSMVRVSIMSAPIDFLEGKERDHYSMVHYHTDNYKKEAAQVINKLAEIAKTKDYFDESDSMTDYFHCSHYIDIAIGKWDKKFELYTTTTTTAKSAEAQPAIEVKEVYTRIECTNGMAPKAENLELKNYAALSVDYAKIDRKNTLQRNAFWRANLAPYWSQFDETDVSLTTVIFSHVNDMTHITEYNEKHIHAEFVKWLLFRYPNTENVSILANAEYAQFQKETPGLF